MSPEDFKGLFESQMSMCSDTLLKKGKEYSTDEDKLYNFKVAAGLQGILPKEACAGFMAKHTVSIYDMCRSGGTFTDEQWNEKITDHINYLILLRALVYEEVSDESFSDRKA
jgi:hypothetical protein